MHDRVASRSSAKAKRRSATESGWFGFARMDSSGARRKWAQALT
jgi:hypothetical protein